MWAVGLGLALGLRLGLAYRIRGVGLGFALGCGAGMWGWDWGQDVGCKETCPVHRWVVWCCGEALQMESCCVEPHRMSCRGPWRKRRRKGICRGKGCPAGLRCCWTGGVANAFSFRWLTDGGKCLLGVVPAVGRKQLAAEGWTSLGCWAVCWTIRKVAVKVCRADVVCPAVGPMKSNKWSARWVELPQLRLSLFALALLCSALLFFLFTSASHCFALLSGFLCFAWFPTLLLLSSSRCFRVSTFSVGF